MNIFALDYDPMIAAQYHCDKHVVKMIVESAQMLSTAHRLLDGSMSIVPYVTKKGKHRTKKVWTLSDSRDSLLYKAAHPSHPSTKWTMKSALNYDWLYFLFCALCDEYTFRYHKIHKTDVLLRNSLAHRPRSIISDLALDITPFALAMKSNPECADPSDPVGSYRKFYQTKQSRFKMVWKNRPIPSWFNVA
jgi:hypothetical protein